MESITVEDINDYQFYQKPHLTKRARKKMKQEEIDAFLYDDGTYKEYLDIKLSFCKEPNETTKINFIPFLYQESQNLENNNFIIYDIGKQKFEVTVSNNPSLKSKYFLYEDNQQFNVFTICRTSDIYKDLVKENKSSLRRQ